MKRLVQKLKAFFDQYEELRGPWLLGYSGGPDSEALLQLLLEIKIEPHLVHIDHQMREESQAEALGLKQKAEALNIPFHLHQIPLSKASQGNLEEGFRLKRYEFFLKTYREIGAKGLLLAHTQDDHAETVLKRVLEGARLYNLKGMAKVSYFQNMTLFRPFLDTKKAELLSYLERRPYLTDKTNFDTHYLRARMRQELFPAIEKSFKKGITSPLAQVGREALRLNDYLQSRLQTYMDQRLIGPFGEALSFSDSMHSVEIRWLLGQMGVNRFEELGRIEEWIEQRAANKRLGSYILDRGTLYKIERPIPKIDFEGELKEKTFDRGDYRIQIQKSSEGYHGLKGIFLGKLKISLPEKPFLFGPRLRKEENNYRIPAFLRPLLPTLYYEGTPYFDWIFSSRKSQNFVIHVVDKTKDNFPALC
ncbi:MAG: tRNA lysidine(34) synthetase TilS [Simkaniaceae bacterium]